MIYTRPTVGAIFGINRRFLWAYLWGWLAYASWPGRWVFEGPGIEAFYVFSMICGLISWSLLHSVFTRIATHYRRDREVVKFNRRGTAPRSDRMADRHDLKQGGLLR